MREIVQKCEPQRRRPCAPKFEERKPCTKKDEPAEKHGRWRKYLQAQQRGQSYVFILIEIKVAPAHILKSSQEEREFVVDMLSKKDLSSEELETLRRSRTPTVVVTANGEVQTNEEAQVYVHDLGSS